MQICIHTRYVIFTNEFFKRLNFPNTDFRKGNKKLCLLFPSEFVLPVSTWSRYKEWAGTYRSKRRTLLWFISKCEMICWWAGEVKCQKKEIYWKSFISLLLLFLIAVLSHLCSMCFKNGNERDPYSLNIKRWLHSSLLKKKIKKIQRHFSLNVNEFFPFLLNSALYSTLDTFLGL